MLTFGQKALKLAVQVVRNLNFAVGDYHTIAGLTRKKKTEDNWENGLMGIQFVSPGICGLID